MQVPLYTISAGDLGTHPALVQQKLSAAFQLARNWSAVLLLDEADVFMEKRSINNMERNQLVSRAYTPASKVKYFADKSFSIPPKPRILPRYSLSHHQSCRNIRPRIRKPCPYLNQLFGAVSCLATGGLENVLRAGSRSLKGRTINHRRGD